MPGFYESLLALPDSNASTSGDTAPSQTSEDVGTYLARRAVPFYSAIRNFDETQAYNAAKQRVASGRSQSVDPDIVSQYETQQRRDESRGVGGQILSAVANIPALVGETAVGGAVLGRLAPGIAGGTSLLARGGRVATTTALAPSFYLQQAAQRASENGGAWYEPQNLGVAGAMGMAQTAILGSLPNIARGVPGNGAAALAARLGIRTGAGMFEQQGVDIIGGLADTVLPQAYQTRTRYGLLGDGLRGEWGHFGQHLAVQAATFAAFSALHRQAAEEKAIEKPTEKPQETPVRPEDIPPAQPLQLPAPSSRAAEQPSLETVQSRMGAARPTEEVVTQRPEPNLATRGASPEAAPVAEKPAAEKPKVAFEPKDLVQVNALAEALDVLHHRGLSIGEATKKLATVRDEIYREFGKPGATKESLDKVADKIKLDPALKAFAEQTAKSLAPYLGTEAASGPASERAAVGGRQPAPWVASELAGKRPPLPGRAANSGMRFEAAPLPRRGPAVQPSPEAPLARRQPGPPEDPPPRPEAPNVPTAPPAPPKPLGKPERSPPPPREAVQEALARHLAGDPTGLSAAVKLGNLTSEEAKVFGARFKVGEKPSFDAIGRELGVSHEQARLLEKSATEKLGLSISVAKASQIAAESGKQDRGTASSAEATGSGGARRSLEDRISDHMGEEIKRAEAAGLPVDPVVKHYAEMLKVDLRKDVVNANQKLLDAGEKPLTAQDHEYISKLAKGEEVPPFAAYLGTRPAEPVKPKRGPGSRLSAGPAGAAERAAVEPITTERMKAVADISMHHAAVLKKVQGMILASNVPTEKKLEYMHNQLRILTEMPPTAAALHSASLRAANFHPSPEAVGQALAASSPEVRAVLQSGDQVGGAYNRGTGTMTLDGGTKDASGARLAGHETAHAIDGPREAISSSPEVINAYLKEGLKGTIGEYARTDHHEFFAETLGLVYSGEMTPAQLKAKMPLMYEAMVSRDLIKRAEGASHFEKPADVFQTAINDGPAHADVLLKKIFGSMLARDKTPERQLVKSSEASVPERLPQFNESDHPGYAAEIWARHGNGELGASVERAIGLMADSYLKKTDILGEILGGIVKDNRLTKERESNLSNRDSLLSTIFGPDLAGRIDHAMTLEVGQMNRQGGIYKLTEAQKNEKIQRKFMDILFGSYDGLYGNDAQLAQERFAAFREQQNTRSQEPSRPSATSFGKDATRLRAIAGEDKSTPEKAMEKAKALDRLSGVLGSGYQKVGAKMWESAKGALDNLKQLSGRGFVQTTAISRPTGEAMGRYAASRVWVQEAIPDFIDLVSGPKATDAMRHQQGAALLELSARHAREIFLKQKDTSKADAVTTFIAGKENSDPASPFKSEAEFQTFLNSDEGKRVQAAYKEHFAPELIEHYKRYKGMTEDEPLFSQAQIPDMPINFMRLEPGESSSPFFAGGGRGNLKNPKMGKLIFDQSATRAHPSYETDLAKIMANSLNKTISLANKKAMYDATVAAGIGERGPSGGRGTLANGDKVWEIPKVYSNGDSHYVSEKIASEMRQVLAVDKPQSIPFVTEASKVLNRAMGAAFAEPVSHIKNQLTALMSVGVNPLEMIPNAIKIINGDVGVRKKILELAKINAGRAVGLESGQLWGGKTDPTTYLSKLIHVMDSATRLTLKSAYDRNVAQGRTAYSETGLRDFVNQGLGDYNKLSQHKLIVLLRDLGIGPFATAGTKFYTSGLRLLVGDPGLTATSKTHALLMRAEILGKIVVAVSAVALANKTLWQHVLGDDDTPLGALKTGKTADGKTTYLDLMAFTGLTRGMRQTGLLALSEGLRQGSSPQRIVDRATEAFYTNLMHPMEGPVVNFAHTLITGRDTFGRDVVSPETAGGSRALESARAAFIQANPLTASALGHDKKVEDMTYGARALDLLGPFNPFKQRGDQVLGEMHGRLRELENLRRAFFTSPENASKPFAREAEYRVLKKFDEAVGKLNDAISGTAQTHQGRRMVAPPETARINELRRQVTELADRAMRTQREYR